MNKTLEKILEDEIFDNETFEGEGSLQIQDTSEGTKLGIEILGNSRQEKSKASKNILDLTKWKQTDIKNITRDKLSENELIISATNEESTTTRGISFNTELEAGTYYISADMDILEGSGGSTFLQIYTPGYIIEKRIYKGGAEKKQIITLEQKSTLYFTFTISESGSGGDITGLKKVSFSNLMISKEDIDYEPFVPQKPSIDYLSENQSCGDNKIININITDNGEQNNGISISTQKPFRAVKDYRDTFIYQNNKWFEKHFIYRYICTGLENNWSLYGSGNLRRFGLELTSNKPQNINGEFQDGLSNYFEIKKGITSDLIGFIQILSHASYLGIMDTEIKWEDVEALKADLKQKYDEGKPLYFDYILAEPELIKCNEEQTKALNKLIQATAYDDITNIICTDEIPCNFKVNAKMSKIKKLIGGK